MKPMRNLRKVLSEFKDDSKMHMVTGFGMCRTCGWYSETVGGVIEHPSLQTDRLERMLSTVKDETRVQVIEHREDTGHDPKIFFSS